MKETAIVEKIKKYLKTQGFWITKLHGGPTQQAGIPDLLAVKGGRAMFFEVKTEQGAVTPLQVHTIEKLRAVGAVAEVVRSVEDVKTVLAGIPF